MTYEITVNGIDYIAQISPHWLVGFVVSDIEPSGQNKEVEAAIYAVSEEVQSKLDDYLSGLNEHNRERRGEHAR